MVDAWEPLDAWPTIIHSHKLLQHLNGDNPVTCLEELVLLEREARRKEWMDAGSKDPLNVSLEDFRRQNEDDATLGD